MPKDYTSTLNLPKTDFSMRANLPQKEPVILKRWNDMRLYDEMLRKNEGGEQFILHDGPPFSNGNIHMGHALNKILKDFVVKSKSAEGYYAPFVPGWDNHGMPIESAIIKKNKLDRKKMSIPEFRDACAEFARKFVERQRDQFARLGVMADWEHPYTTMNPKFEQREVLVFGEMYRKGYIYKGLKPVFWCPHDETALAEAEIEYSKDKCESVYVKFKVTYDKGLFGAHAKDAYFIIWTTTPWTLPGNLAIAVHPAEEYVLIRSESRNESYVVAKALAEQTMKEGHVTDHEIIGSFTGSELEFCRAAHPFLNRESVVLTADYVTTDSGTGCVHTAPGFGADDYETCKRYGMGITVPVDDRGYQTAEAGKFAGMYYADSDKAITDEMRESGALFASAEIEHDYPHCWRCKRPVIFRATSQWFCSVEKFKDEAVRACSEVKWIPAWGGERIASMIEERSDWCISRQRHWGLPIPVFYCKKCGKPVCNDETVRNISELFGLYGSNIWYIKDEKDLLPENFVCPHCGGGEFSKETDTLDGWFDSGSTHYSVIENGGYDENWSKKVKWPCDLYLEGADQYRGWFQSSLLTAVGANGGGAPYKCVLTHGWTVDGEGRAMHKSLGNGVDTQEMVKKYGADLVRLWVASADYKVDVRVSDGIFGQLSETYRKIRNTARIMLANLGDFDPQNDAVSPDDLADIDKWILTKLNALIRECVKAYDCYSFHLIYHAVNNFCTTDMSKLYIDITKDRVYTGSKKGVGRRSAQTAMYRVLSALTRLIAPILSFTAEEIWGCMPHVKTDNRESVFLNAMPEADERYEFGEIYSVYEKLFSGRDMVMKALEIARADKKIGKSLDAAVAVHTENEEIFKLLSSFGGELATVYIVSEAKVVSGKIPEGAYTEPGSEIGVVVKPAEGEKCDRCWMHSAEGKKTEDGFICARCLRVLEEK